MGSTPPVSTVPRVELLLRHLDRAGEPDTEAGLITAMTVTLNYTPHNRDDKKTAGTFLLLYVSLKLM